MDERKLWGLIHQINDLSATRLYKTEKPSAAKSIYKLWEASRQVEFHILTGGTCRLPTSERVVVKKLQAAADVLQKSSRIPFKTIENATQVMVALPGQPITPSGGPRQRPQKPTPQTPQPSEQGGDSSGLLGTLSISQKNSLKR